jgi:hypothetical protein
VPLYPFCRRIRPMFLAPPKAGTTFCSTPGTGSPVSSLSKNSNCGRTEAKGFVPDAELKRGMLSLGEVSQISSDHDGTRIHAHAPD